VVHIRVQDTGIGIPAEDIPRLFQPFEQMNDSKGRKKGGTGLGSQFPKRSFSRIKERSGRSQKWARAAPSNLLYRLK